MAEGYLVVVEGLDVLQSFEKLDQRIVVAARRAVNKATDRGRAMSARRIREQVNFPATYLSGEGGRLTVTKRATDNDLEGVISGRQRATSLARFQTGAPRKSGVMVKIKPAGATFMRRAFLIPLRAGNTDTKGNVGLAVRTPNGEKPSAAFKPAQIGKGLWLLYGPSVDQVFRTVADDVSPDVADIMESEFLRLIDLGDF